MGPQVVHVVLVRWAHPTAPDLMAQLERAVRAVHEEIPGVVEVAHGPSISVEGLERGFEYGLYVRFADAAARDAYLPHPAHQPLAALISSSAETFVVFDLPAGNEGRRSAGRRRA